MSDQLTNYIDVVNYGIKMNNKYSFIQHHNRKIKEFISDLSNFYSGCDFYGIKPLNSNELNRLNNILESIKFHTDKLKNNTLIY